MSLPTTPKSTFKAAAPYGILALGVGAAGAVAGLACTATALKIIGIAGAIIGAYSFFAILICGFMNMGQPEKFKQDLPKYLGIIVGSAIADIIKNVAIETISGLIDGALGRQSSTIRRSRF
ncbi:MAG: hypothetical protein K1060chlam1_00176 [Candidatus Anoxychlamydiales bacterium]|nr:hypothetical protein [Candidatus Anoxychlamydiales bacterium]